MSLVGYLSGSGTLDSDTGQVIRITRFMLLFSVLNSSPDRNRIPEMIPITINGCSCLKMLTMTVRAVSSMKMANCPDDRPKNLIGLLIYAWFSWRSALDDQKSYHDDHYGNNPSQQIFFGVGIVRGQ